MYLQTTQLNNLTSLISSYDNHIQNLEEKIDYYDYQIRNIDKEINSVLNNLNEGKLARLRILQEIKHNLVLGLSEIISEYREILKGKSDIYKFILKVDIENKINEVVDDSNSEKIMFEIVKILENFQRRNKEYSDVIKEILNEIQNVLNLKSDNNSEKNSYNINE